VNVGYNVFAAHRGSGYASRAVELLIRHLAESTAFDAATLVIHPDNAASLAVAAKCGFVPNGEIESSRYFKRLIKVHDCQSACRPTVTDSAGERRHCRV